MSLLLLFGAPAVPPPVVDAMTFVIAGMDHTSDVMLNRVRINMGLGSDWTAEFSIQDSLSTSSAYRPSLGQSVVINYGASAFFNGRIASVSDKPLAPPHIGTMTDVRAEAYSGVVDQIIVSVTFPASNTLLQNVTALRSTYMSAYGITLDPTMGTGPTLEAQVFHEVTMREALNHLSTITGWLWRITPDNELQFFPGGDKTASYSLTAANRLSVGPVTWEQSREKYVNSVTLRYGTESQIPKTHTITGDGIASDWLLDYDSARNPDGYILSAGYVTDNGVFSPLSPFGGTTDWQFGSGTNRIYKTSGALGVGVVATFVYSAQFPQTITVEDTAGIATNGKYAAVFEAPDIFDKDAATELGTGLLRRYLAEPKWVYVSTREDFVMPGDEITLTFADRVVSGAHIVTQVKMSTIATGIPLYELTCLSGAEHQDTWTDRLKQLIGSGGSNAAGGTIAGSIVPNFSGHFDSAVSAHTGGAVTPDFESSLDTYQNSGMNGPALILGRSDQGYRWAIVADSQYGSTPGTTGRLMFHVPRRGSAISCAFQVAEPDASGSDNFVMLPGIPANLYLGDYAGILAGLSPSDSRIEGILTANIMATSGYFERSRTTRMGEWIDVAFAAGNFTASGAMTWTVASGDQQVYRYTLIGKTLTVTFSILTTTVAGTPDPELRIAIPGGLTAAQTTILGAIWALDNGTQTLGLATTLAGASYIRLYRAGLTNWAASTNNTAVGATVDLEVE